MKKHLLAYSVSLLVGLTSHAAHAQSLSELFEAARAYDSGFQAAKLTADASNSRIAQAKGATGPQAGLSASLSQAISDIYPGSIDRTTSSQSVGVNGSYSLWNPAKKLNLEQAQRAAELSRIALETSEQELMVRVSQAYFDVLAAQDTLTFVKAQKAAVAEQLSAAKRNFEVGTSTITDQREAQARFDLVVAQEIAAENDLIVKRNNLDQIVGKPASTPKPLAANAKLPTMEANKVSEWLAQGEANHPAIRQSQIAIELARLDTEKAKASEKPTLEATAGYNINRSSGQGPSATRSNTAAVGVNFSMPLWTSGSTQARIKETLILEDKARADLETAKRTIATATRQAYFGVISAQGQIKALEAAEASTQSALDANKLGYQVGVRINIDVLNSQSQLFQTKRDLAKAKYDLLVGGLRLRQANGTLRGEDLQMISSLLR